MNKQIPVDYITSHNHKASSIHLQNKIILCCHFFYKKEEETIQFNDGFATSSLQKKREQVREPVNFNGGLWSSLNGCRYEI